MGKITIESTGSLFIDTIILNGLFEFLYRADPLLKLKARIGGRPLADFYIREERINYIANVLKDIVESADIESRLGKIPINKGGTKNVPASTDLKNLMEKVCEKLSYKEGILEWIEQQITLRKTGDKSLSLLPMSIAPIYGKGLRRWNAFSTGHSMRASDLLVILYYIGFAYYCIFERVENTRIHLLVSPRSGVDICEEDLFIVRRIASQIYGEEGRRLSRLFIYFPSQTIPLLTLSILDLSSFLLLNPPDFIYWVLQREEGGGEAVREFKIIRTSPIINFFNELCEFTYEFKRFLCEVSFLAFNDNFRSRIIDIILHISRAINYKDPESLNLAIHNVNKLNKELPEDKKLYLPRDEVFSYATYILSKRL
ncbi:MAG: hypothetical protein QXK35_06130 [Nitrososphaerales archaeon]